MEAQADSDVFMLSNAEDLVPLFKRDAGNHVVFGNNGPLFNEVPQGDYFVRRYSPRIEGSFTRVERWMNSKDPDDIFWRTTTSDTNVTTLYGKDDNSRIYDPN